MQVSNAATALRAALIAVSALIVLSATGCATPDGEFGATFDPLSPFPARALWVWDEAQNKLPDDDRLDLAALDQRIKSTAAVAFGARGYSLTSAPKVHYMLSYEVGIHTWMSPTEARAFGTLSILMTEAASGRKVWLGFVRLQIDTSLTDAQRDERLRAALANMLENFPPAQPET